MQQGLEDDQLLSTMLTPFLPKHTDSLLRVTGALHATWHL